MPTLRREAADMLDRLFGEWESLQDGTQGSLASIGPHAGQQVKRADD